MATIREFFQNLLYQVPAIGISDIVDILVVSIIFYSLLRLIRSTSAARVARAILLLLAITLLTDVLNLYTLNWLLNKILGEERVIVSNIAGTTRDAIDSYFENATGKYNFIDTAGMRKKSKVDDAIEKYSVLRATMAIERSDV